MNTPEEKLAYAIATLEAIVKSVTSGSMESIAMSALEKLNQRHD